MYKAIKGYEGIYEVNEFGQVRSVDRIVECKDGSIRKYNGKDLQLNMNKAGYAVVILSKNGISKTLGVHRLVAGSFLPNPDNLPQVHHINHDRNDNRVQNLRWVTSAEQMDNHWRAAKGTGLRVVGNGIDKMFISSMEVERELGVSSSYVLDTAK